MPMSFIPRLPRPIIAAGATTLSFNTTSTTIRAAAAAPTHPCTSAAAPGRLERSSKIPSLEGGNKGFRDTSPSMPGRNPQPIESLLLPLKPESLQCVWYHSERDPSY